MNPQDTNKKQYADGGILYRWAREIVGSYGVFMTHFITVAALGFCYAFGLIESHMVLVLQSLIFPVLYAVISFRIFRLMTTEFPDFDKRFSLTKRKNKTVWLFVLDICGCVLICAAILFNFTNFFIIRFWATFITPLIMLLGMRVLYVSNEALRDGRNDLFDM